MTCPMCGADGADDQPVGPAVTVFCCSTCLTSVLRSFAGHADQTRPPRPAPAPVPAGRWGPAPA